MKAIVYRAHGGIEELRLEQFPTPVPGPRDALIRIRAASLNGFDPMMLAGSTGLKVPLPMIPLGDLAGDIVQLGPDVSKTWKVGDRVCPYPYVPGEGMGGETRLGAAAEYICFPEQNLIRMPPGLSYIDAAALPIAYGTALRMVRFRGKIRAGEKVLVLGATGGVGTCVIQLAKQAGAVVIACGSSAWKLDRLRQIGADHVIDISSQDTKKALHTLFGKPRVFGDGGGVDVVVNYVGGDTWDTTLQVLARGGRVLICGATAGVRTPVDMRYVWSFEHQLLGCNGWLPEDQVEVMRMVSAGELKPVIHAVAGLEGTAGAMRDLIERKVIGKSIICPDI